MAGGSSGSLVSRSRTQAATAPPGWWLGGATTQPPQPRHSTLASPHGRWLARAAGAEREGQVSPAGRPRRGEEELPGAPAGPPRRAGRAQGLGDPRPAGGVADRAADDQGVEADP